MATRKELLDTADYVVMEMEHYRVHQGEMFNFSLANTLAAAAVQDVLIVTPAAASGYQHAKIAIMAEAAAKIQFYGDGGIATTSSYGTSVASYNMNRNSSKTNGTGFFITAAFTTTLGSPILLDTAVIGTTGSPVTRIGGESRPGNEWILKPSTQYVIRTTNLAAATQTVSINMQYYTGIKGD